MSDVSFFKKEKIKCPVCSHEFPKEEMRSGGGRLVAKDVTLELRREYKITEKFGRVSPLVFSTVTCPNCYYTTFGYDFNAPQSLKGLDNAITNSLDERKNELRTYFPMANFTRNKTFFEGAASYLLAIKCYEYFPDKSCPAIKQGICSMRAAWLCSDLNEDYPNNGYDKLSEMFYKMAMGYYQKAMEYEETGQQSVMSVPTLGPDSDYNYSFDGALYLYIYLYKKYGDKDKPEQRTKTLDSFKFSISKIFGMGKKSSSKPAVILDSIRNIYEEINQELDGKPEA